MYEKSFPLLLLTALVGLILSGFVSASPTQTPSTPVLLTQESTNRAIAFDSVTLMKEPFEPQAPVKFSDDGRTRIMLFTTNLVLLPGEDASSITAEAEDGTHRFYDFPVEAVFDLPVFNSFQTVIVKTSDDLTNVGDVLVSIKVHGQASNRVRIGIGYIGGGPADDSPVPTPTPTPLSTPGPTPIPTPTQTPLGISTPVATVVAGADISASLTGNTSAVNASYDWIGLYQVNAENTAFLSWTRPSLGSDSVFTATFVVPMAPGQYEFRYLPMNGFADIARRPFTVIAATPTPTPTPQPTPTPIPIPTPTPTPSPTPIPLAPILVTQTSSVTTTGEIAVSLTGKWAPTGDYVALYKAGTPDDQYLNFKVAAANLTFTAPTTEGTYNFRYLARTLSGNYYVAATSNIVTVSSSQPTPTPTLTPAPTATPTPTPASTPGPTPVPSGECTWYVATNGSSSNNGTIGSPWSMFTIAGGVPGFDDNPAPPASIHPGDTICLRGGTYTSQSSTVFFRTTLAGTPGHQITIMSYPGERAILDAANPALGNARNEILILEGPNVTVRDIEITDSWPNRTDARPGGIQTSQAASGAQIINNYIHDTGDGIDKNNGAADTTIYGNIVYNVGWDDRLNGLKQGGTGHGTYSANQSGFVHFYKNFIIDSFGFGVHFYSAGSGNFNGVDIEDCVVINSGYWTRYHDSPYATEGRATDNYLVGHRPVTGMIFTRNYGYHREGRGTQNFQLGYAGEENISGTVTNNTLIGGVNSIDHFETFSFTNNYISTSNEMLQFIAADTPASTTITNNIYFYYPGNGNRKDCSTPPFGLTAIDTATTITQWKALGFDTGSTFNTCGTRDSTITARIIPNVYDANRFHVIVNNPRSVTNVTLNLSSALSNGDTFQLMSAQDPQGVPVASGTYSGPISINMTTLPVAKPIGYDALPNTTPITQMTSGPQFGAFILIKN